MKNELLPVTVTTVWMDREGIMLAEVSQAGEDKHRTISFICKILKSKTNKQIKTETDSQIPSNLVVARREAVGGWAR